MELHLSDGEQKSVALLGPDLSRGQRPQLIVPSDEWQKSVPVQKSVTHYPQGVNITYGVVCSGGAGLTAHPCADRPLREVPVAPPAPDQ